MNLDDIKKISSKTMKLLNNLGINNIYDLVTYYPYRYEILKRSKLNELIDGQNIIIDGIVESMPNLFYYGKKKNIMSFRINSNGFIFSVSIYNRGYLKSKISIGNYVTVIGKYNLKNSKIVANDIKLSKLPDKPIVEVIYHTTNGITSKQLNNFILEGLDKIKINNYVPLFLVNKYDFMDKMDALKEIHKPTSSLKLKDSIRFLKYEELFIFMLKINNLKNKRNSELGIERNVDYLLIDKFIKTLPFTLTTDQVKCINDIYNDLICKKRMNRLLQGDVGSGKTIVSFIALYINYLSNYQGVLMAPTEVLASQHYSNINKYLKNINIALLTGTTKRSERKKILEEIKSGKVDIIIGTHALFSEDVVYNNLGLVITDEQHRFGVQQRHLLRNKGHVPDVLYLSATPIPRTYALTIYGDMDISNIKTVPNGKKDIITILKGNHDIKEVLNMMYQELICKHQIYVIAPLVEESEKIDLENVNSIYEKMNKAFSKICKIGIMHGKLSKKEKEQVMTDFVDGKIGILVSTTVIEVGVDVKNATMIVIFDSYRFGLSQLHQLRGRVGRNNMQSYCILISDCEKERLQIMTKTNDGFKISEEDFRLRGSGDLFGVKQSGDMNFKLANIKTDFNLLVKAKNDSLEYLNKLEYHSNNEDINEIIENISNLD